MSERMLSIGILALVSPLAGERLAMEVRIQDYAALPRGHWSVAKATAHRAFRDAGVWIDWLDCSPPNKKRHQKCAAALGRNTRVLRILPREQALKMKPASGELGRAHLGAKGAGGVFASIFHHQVMDLAADALQNPRLGALTGKLTKPLLQARLLGYTIAHELAHLLGNPHASDGLMHVQWSQEELADILVGALRFSRSEVQVIVAALSLPRD